MVVLPPGHSALGRGSRRDGTDPTKTLRVGGLEKSPESLSTTFQEEQKTNYVYFVTCELIDSELGDLLDRGLDDFLSPV